MALAHAILASLIDRPCSGYDLAKQFDGSVGFFWQATHQQIYRELSKLETQGWITSETISQEGRPDKKLYSVTELGKQRLKEWIAQPCEPTPIKDDLLVKIFGGYVASQETILEELERHRQAHLERLSTYKALERQYFQNFQELSEPAKFHYLTLLKGIGYETHWLAWCDQAIKLLKSTV
ncbi:PadR family transcriptional regulator [Fischerella sp. PCC 9605]|jgi:DNA-binding PadR family transcriptional regulator|uniref:PadR family transcriptional regulator n=1 Tax=Fischerella sp. PCC 9605 TaxID=1173024 RepID=UPI000479E710|nr:PadR family transcriptional regulator [Fischerella sp. PCC 9605]